MAHHNKNAQTNKPHTRSSPVHFKETTKEKWLKLKLSRAQSETQASNLKYVVRTKDESTNLETSEK